jgi:hypothetical protein
LLKTRLFIFAGQKKTFYRCSIKKELLNFATSKSHCSFFFKFTHSQKVKNLARGESCVWGEILYKQKMNISGRESCV